MIKLAVKSVLGVVVLGTATIGTMLVADVAADVYRQYKDNKNKKDMEKMYYDEKDMDNAAAYGD